MEVGVRRIPVASTGVRIGVGPMDPFLASALEAAFLGSDQGRHEVAFFAQLPDSAVSAAFGAYWVDERLFRVADTLPIEHVPLERVRWVLDVKWKADGESMNGVRERGDHSSSWRRAMAADLRFPIVLGRRPDRWTVLDGYHRVLKADVEARESIRAVRLPAGRVHEVLVAGGFFGELNRLWIQGFELIHGPARIVARNLLARGLVGSGG